MRPYKRKKYIVDKNFQVKFILTFVIICILGMTIALGLFQYLTINGINALKWKMAFYEETLADIAAPHLIYLSAFAVLFTALTASLILWYLTSKVAGPVYRMKRDIETVGDGNLSINVRLRKNDVFKETASELDSMVTALRVRFKKIHEDFSAVEKIVDTMRDARGDLLRLKSEHLFRGIEKLNNTLKGS